MPFGNSTRSAKINGSTAEYGALGEVNPVVTPNRFRGARLQKEALFDSCHFYFRGWAATAVLVLLLSDAFFDTKVIPESDA
jgi:hypothetical protein